MSGTAGGGIVFDAVTKSYTRRAVITTGLRDATLEDVAVQMFASVSRLSRSLQS